MSDHIQDELWPHFVPVWTDFRESSEVRDLEWRQAQKHTEDVFRIVAMMTREESEATTEVLKVVRDGSSYLAAEKRRDAAATLPVPSFGESMLAIRGCRFSVTVS